MNQKNNKTIYLSPTKLSLFQKCPLCFWLEIVKGVYLPEVPSSTLLRGMDLLIKEYFDHYRKLKDLPPEIKGKVQGSLLPDQKLIDEWRKTSKNSQPNFFDKKLNACLFGGLDECFVDGDFYIPADYKTRGFDLKEDSLDYYQIQLDCYTLLLELNGFRHLSFGYLIYYIPIEVREYGKVEFKIEVHKLTTDPKKGYEIFKKAVKCIRGRQPDTYSSCNYCNYHLSRNNLKY